MAEKQKNKLHFIFEGHIRMIKKKLQKKKGLQFQKYML